MLTKENAPLLSVIVPVYNTEEFLPECLESIINQTYTNLEIIVVNDGSPGNCDEIVAEFAKKDKRIKYVIPSHNEGLLTARFRGFEQATGEYIAFVDSDDSIGIDYYRLFIKKALEEDADIVTGCYTSVYENGIKKTHNMAYNYINFINYKGTDVFDNFVNSEGYLTYYINLCYKIYKKDVLEKSYPCLSEIIDKKVTYFEDLLLSYVVYFFAQHIVGINVNTYYYKRFSGVSSSKTIPFQSFLSKVENAYNVKCFIINWLEKINKIEKGLILLRNRMYSFAEWQKKLVKASGYSLKEKNRLVKKLDTLIIDYNPKFIDNFYFFHQEFENSDDRYEKLKDAICSNDTKIVSFDIFDTLILRPFQNPLDLFLLLNETFFSLTKKMFSDFTKIRCEAEKIARENEKNAKNPREDITLDEIYDVLVNEFGVSAKNAEIMKNEEIRLEIKFCTPRKSAKELYELALWLGKKVVFISDMYLSLDTIKKMLDKCGYTKVDQIFLSSDIGLLKHTCNLFKYALKEIGYRPENVLHIGDNYNADFENAKSVKMNAFHFPKPIDLLLNKIPDINGKYSYPRINDVVGGRHQPGSYMSYCYANQSIAVKIALGLTANKMFDNPFAPYVEWTNFNMNPYYMGYGALGLHLVSLTNWIYKSAKADNKSQVNFIARDGLLPMKAFEIFREYFNDIPNSNYVYASRGANFPLMFKHKEDLLNIIENKSFSLTKGNCVEFLLELLSPLFKQDYKLQEEEYNKNGINFSDTDLSVSEQVHLLNVIGEVSFDQETADDYHKTMAQYYNEQLPENSVIFDAGYSGRPEVMFTELLGRPIDAYFIHSNGMDSDINSRHFGFCIKTLYNFKPAISGGVRELVLSGANRSCSKFNIQDNKVTPVFEDFEYNFCGKWIVNIIQQGSLDFVKDFLEVTEGNLSMVNIETNESNVIWEWFLHKPQNKDMQVFKQLELNSDIRAPHSYKNAFELWNTHLKNIAINNRPNPSNYRSEDLLYRQSLFYTLKNERYNLKESVWLKLQDHPFMFKIARKTFRFVKKNPILKKTAKKIMRMDSDKKIEKKPKVVSQTVEKQNISGDCLYYCQSRFNLLSSIIHKIKYNTNKKSILFLIKWPSIIDNIDIKTLESIFEEVVIFNYSEINNLMRKMSVAEDAKKIFKLYDERLLFDVKKIKDIYVCNDGTSFSAYLINNDCRYNIIEEGQGNYSDTSVQLFNIKKTSSPFEMKLIEKYHLLYQSPKVQQRFLNFSAQVKDFDPTDCVDFNVSEIMKTLDNTTLKKIFACFNLVPKKANKNIPYNLLLTYPLWRVNITEQEAKNLYLQICDFFFEKENLVIKPHPGDPVLYNEVFPEDVIHIDKGVLSELLPYAIPVKYDKAVSVISSSNRNLQDVIKSGIYFNQDFMYYYKDLYKYYALAILIGEISKDKKTFSIALSQTLYEEPLFNMLKYSNINSKTEYNFVEDENSSDLFVVTNESDYDSTLPTIIMDEKYSRLEKNLFNISLITETDLLLNSVLSVKNISQLDNFSFERSMHYCKGAFYIDKI